jgi:copper chaperone
MSSQQTFEVTGMTCEHCVAAVNAKLSELAGVSRVDVDLPNGVVVVNGPDIDGEAVRAAVQAAGYGVSEPV